MSKSEALKITCPVCHAPVGVSCVTIIWRATCGQYMPHCEDREYHSKRLKKIVKFGLPLGDDL